MTLDPSVLQTANDNEAVQITYQTEDGQTVTTIASSTEAADIVSKAFTTVADGTEGNVEYITMTPEEAAAAGVVTNAEEEEQVVTTSLQFDPANPSVLYTADGTPINQSDLTPEEQALVQAALQQHLAEQEAEQQLAIMQEGAPAQSEATEGVQIQSVPAVTEATDGSTVSSTSIPEQQPVPPPLLQKQEPQITAPATQPIMVSSGLKGTVADTTVTSTGEPVVFRSIGDGFDLASPSTSASQIVQTLANNVRKKQIEEKYKLGMQQSVLKDNNQVIKYSEKIVIKEGQPQVVKVPIKKQPEIPAALANLMPKVEIGKDGSQVIRIHQSQITPGQLKALQDNPNVRLVFRPASSSRPKAPLAPISAAPPAKKRGRPRKNPDDPTAKIVSDKPDSEPEIEDPPAKTRCGRVSKRPVYTKDYLTPKISKEMDEDGMDDVRDDMFTPKTDSPAIVFGDRRPRGRPPTSAKSVKRASYASKIEALQGRDEERDFYSLTSSKPTLTPIEQALSTRRKNRLREMLGACSEDEIMEVAMPHIARVFSLWEFLVTKVEKNKMSRVFFADIYKEYECLHKYVAKLAEKYKQTIEEKKAANANTKQETVNGDVSNDTPNTTENDKSTEPKENEELGENVESKSDETKEEPSKEDGNEVKILFTKLAESLGLQGSTLEEAEINLLDPVDAIGPRIMSMIHSSARRAHGYANEDKSVRRSSYTTFTTADVKKDVRVKATAETVKPVQTEATSTISSVTSPAQNAIMPPLKPMGQTEQVPASADARVEPVAAAATTVTQPAADVPAPMETEEAPQSAVETSESNVVAGEGETTAGTGTQLIQIGQGEDQQFIEVPEGYTLIQTPEGLVMSQPGTTISQGEDGTIYITHADGTTTPLNAATQQAVQMETVESLLSLDGQQPET